MEKEYADCRLIFTDGSKTNDGRVGAGKYFPDLVKKLAYGLPQTCVMGAELVAILMALGAIEDCCCPGGPRVVICTDSISSLL